MHSPNTLPCPMGKPPTPLSLLAGLSIITHSQRLASGDAPLPRPRIHALACAWRTQEDADTFLQATHTDMHTEQ